MNKIFNMDDSGIPVITEEDLAAAREEQETKDECEDRMGTN